MLGRKLGSGEGAAEGAKLETPVGVALNSSDGIELLTKLGISLGEGLGGLLVLGDAETVGCNVGSIDIVLGEVDR